MNTDLFILSIIQLTMSVFVGVMVLYLTYGIVLKNFERRKFKVQSDNDNVAFAVYISAVLFSVGIIVSTAFEPAISIIDLIKATTTTKTDLFFEFLKYLSLFILIGLSISAIVITISFKLFNFLTKKVDEVEEIASNNIAVALIMGVIVIIISIFAKDSVSMIIQSLMPYTEVPIIF
jgi:uncharacterized membrane protein YjfL (UPF0719 family)